jgi:hypothetical protein
MRIERIVTKQGHAVPEAAYAPRGPFPAELFTAKPVITDYVAQSDSGGPELPEGATAQNNYREVRWFRCRDCFGTVRENELDSHNCDD